MKKRTVAIAAYILYHILYITNTIFYATLAVPSISGNKFTLVYTPDNEYPATSVAHIVKHTNEEYSVAMSAPNQPYEISLTTDRDGRGYGCLYIPYNGGIDENFTCYLNGNELECRDGWITTPDRQLWHLGVPSWLKEITSSGTEIENTKINGVFVFADWVSSTPSVLAEWLTKNDLVCSLLSADNLMPFAEWLVKQDWFLGLRIFTLEHGPSAGTIILIRRVFGVLRLFVDFMLLGIIIFSCVTAGRNNSEPSISEDEDQD